MLVVLTQENHIWLSHYANGVPVDVEKDGKNEIDSDNHQCFGGSNYLIKTLQNPAGSGLCHVFT